MSVLINEKLHSRRLKWRWPLSRQVTLSIGTLAVLLTVWWTVATLQLISPLFLPPPQQVLEKLLTIAGPQGFMDATLWQHLAASLTRIMLALFAAVLFGIPVGIAMGLSPTVRGILDPIIELYRPVPPPLRNSWGWTISRPECFRQTRRTMLPPCGEKGTLSLWWGMASTTPRLSPRRTRVSPSVTGRPSPGRSPTSPSLPTACGSWYAYASWPWP